MGPSKKPRPKAKKGTFKRLIRELFSFYPKLLPITMCCIIFSAAIGAIPALFMSKVYGKIEAPLNIYTSAQINDFIEGVRSGKSTELMNITGGYHFHTVRADSDEILDRVESALRDAGYLVED